MKEKTVTIGIRIPVPLFAALKSACESSKTDVSKFVRKALAAAVSEPKSIS